MNLKEQLRAKKLALRIRRDLKELIGLKLSNSESEQQPIQTRSLIELLLVNELYNQGQNDYMSLFELMHELIEKAYKYNSHANNMTKTYIDRVAAQVHAIESINNDLRKHFDTYPFTTDRPQGVTFIPGWFTDKDKGQ